MKSVKRKRCLPQFNLSLAIVESALTSGVLSMSIMTPFFKSIGLTQVQISLTQAIFTIVVLVLNFPAGWLADRLSRKMANAIGDFGVGLAFLAYSRADSFWSAVACECALGFLLALSQGVDATLIRHFSYKIVKLARGADSPDLEEYQKQAFSSNNAKNATWSYIATAIVLLLGAPIGAISFRLAIALSGVPYFIGGIVSLLMVDDSPKLQPKHRNPFCDMARIIKSSIHNRRLAIRILAFASGREMTHAIIWVFTPMLLYAGVPLSIVSMSWVINSGACLLGAKIAKKFAPKLQDYQKVAIPVVLVGVSMAILSIKINLFTVCFYWLMGIVQGWTRVMHLPLVQEHVTDDEQTSVVSLAHVLGQLIYIPVTILVGACADIDLRLAPLATLIIFMPLGIFVSNQLRREPCKNH